MSARILVGNDHRFDITITAKSEDDGSPIPPEDLVVTGHLLDDDNEPIVATATTLAARTDEGHENEFFGYLDSDAVDDAIANKSTIRERYTWNGGQRERVLTVVDPAVDP